ncbi:MAG: sigma-54-dependent Fis family transcriptional regulator [Gammaproteobacteria bacterium]|nr:sigma-54-dependent Fis family transcriptional regulator [Gammaproteobacteria bacterium]NIR81795.1 sigma-54-dependent Fis family transcriptional regulator [Gammaproteobacteria bacterium]NIR88627.1 sigma-54-dependent Fis family transcriptional regulator [Gammaproteobacteria bacterium]NIU02903.1 sigma-54-dependent Fis family transcriptional regulator [Gammaproteobacteria bacterium]NIV50424.1 response regulator [Gammaproteobacteria bacterium]
MNAPNILVVDDEPDIRTLVKEILEDEGFVVAVAEDAQTARQARRTRRPDLTLLDIWMPDTDGITLLKEWSQAGAPDTPVIMMSGHGTVETAVEATRLGAYDFIEKPLSLPKLLLTVRHALEATQLKQENVDLRQEVHPLVEPIGRSTVMQRLREQAKRIAEHDTPVLMAGESGSGKQMFARYIHTYSGRAAGPFVRVAIGSLANSDLGIELFGAENGPDIHYGSFERANGGTLFLEDVAETEPSIQARLYTALKHQSFVRLGGVQPVSVNVRIIAATREDLHRAVEAGRFHEDLYYHLNVVPLNIPPLREHREDVPELLEYYVDLLVSQENHGYRRFTVAAKNRLRNHPWPGNVRELKNMVQRLLILGAGPDIDLQEVQSAVGKTPRPAATEELPGFDLPLKEAREQFERAYLEHQLKRGGGSIGRIAKQVGLERTHLYRKLRALGIDPKRAANTD